MYGETESKGSFWTTIPGCLTGIAAILTAIGGLITVLFATGLLQIPSNISSASPSPALVQPFSASWQGSDPDDGSIIVLSLKQTGNKLEGTFSDTFSKQNDGTIIRPGFVGPGQGSVSPANEGQMTFDITRSDGVYLQLITRLILSNQNNTLTLVVESPASSSIILERK